MKTILFIKINPIGTVNLRLDEEEKALREVLDLSIHREDFSFESRGAVTTNDLHQYLEQIKPYILHISGHGSEEGVLFFHDSEGHKKEVSIAQFCDFLKNFDSHIDSVFLNACFSLSGIDSIKNPSFHIIGMKDEIPNDTALGFARAFYTSHCNGKPVKESFETAKDVVSLEGFNDELIPRYIESTEKPVTPVEKDEEEIPDEDVVVQEVIEEDEEAILQRVTTELVSEENRVLFKTKKLKNKRSYYFIAILFIVISLTLIGISIFTDQDKMYSIVGALPLALIKWIKDKVDGIDKSLTLLQILDNEIVKFLKGLKTISTHGADERVAEFNKQFWEIIK